MGVQEEGMSIAETPLLAPLALTVDIPDKRLTRGQIGTVVEFLERDGEQALPVEFSDENGETYAMIDRKPEQLIVLRRRVNVA